MLPCCGEASGVSMRVHAFRLVRDERCGTKLAALSSMVYSAGGCVGRQAARLDVQRTLERDSCDATRRRQPTLADVEIDQRGAAAVPHAVVGEQTTQRRLARLLGAGHEHARPIGALHLCPRTALLQLRVQLQVALHGRLGSHLRNWRRLVCSHAGSMCSAGSLDECWPSGRL